MKTRIAIKDGVPTTYQTYQFEMGGADRNPEDQAPHVPESLATSVSGADESLQTARQYWNISSDTQ